MTREELRQALVISALSGAAYRIPSTGGVYEAQKVDGLILRLVAEKAVMVADEVLRLLYPE